jgi:hypothetical protein
MVLKVKHYFGLRLSFTDRRHRIVIGEIVSGLSAVTSGVHQDSELGPYLSILYIKDMPDALLKISQLIKDIKMLSLDEDHFHDPSLFNLKLLL